MSEEMLKLQERSYMSHTSGSLGSSLSPTSATSYAKRKNRLQRITLRAFEWGTRPPAFGIHNLTVPSQADRASMIKALWEALPHRNQLLFNTLVLYKV